MILVNWLQDHWPEVLAYLGIGGGSGILGKKLTDKKQDTKIKQHEEKINHHEEDIKVLKKVYSSQSKAILKVENDLKHNTDWDRQLREDLKSQREDIKEKFNKLEESQRDQFNKIDAGQNQLRDMMFQFINQKNA